MTHSSHVETWNNLRRQIIQAQMSSVIILSVALALVATGQFAGASLTVKLFAIAVVFTTGSLSLVNQFAAIREGAALIADLTSASETEKTIAKSASYLKLTQAMMVAFAITTLVLFILAIF
jgi:hypothetical protein